MRTLLLLLAVCPCAFAQYSPDHPPTLPDPALTPGVATNAPIRAVLAHNYTKGVRNVPDSLKREVFVRYFGSVPKDPGSFEIDHLVSLVLSGENSISNLWPQSYLTQPWNSHTKDRLEVWLATDLRHMLAKDGPAAASNKLAAYQREISSNWIACYLTHIGTNKTVMSPKDAHEAKPVRIGGGQP